MHITSEIAAGIATVVMAIMEFAIDAGLVEKLAAAIAAAIAAYVAARLHLSARDRNEITHALEYALNRLAEGAMSRQEALSHILATGAVKNRHATEIVDATKTLLDRNGRSAHPAAGLIANSVPGISVVVRPDGAVDVSSIGKPSKLYKINKFVKKKFGFML